MFKGILSKIAGDSSQKELAKLQPTVEAINALEPEFERLSDDELRDKTTEFVGRFHAGESLEDLLPEAFAAVREAAKRTTGMRHFDVQLVGGIVLHQGKVAEMKTGEGKTLVAPLAAYLDALTGRGVHVVTVNDYLARRDAQWMGPIYDLLGLRVGLLQQGGESFLFDRHHTTGKYPHLRPSTRQEAYQADVTYGTNHEFGFDYLRDNLAFDIAQRVQRELNYAIVDEVDYILIDEARTPLIISGPSDEPLEEYVRFAQIAKKLRSEVDYEVDEKEQVVTLTEQGLANVEQESGIFDIYDERNYQYVHYMEQALKAQVLFRRDRDYIRQGQNIILIDEFTGRLMPDRRLSDGLHQAIEAKEGVRIQPRNMTHATITLQNYFRLYEKLAGMTGTAATEEEEFHKIYGLDVVVIPTNEPMIRIDHPDVVYRTEEAKWEAIVREIEECYRAGRPVLVGTTSVERSEKLSRRLKARNIKHEVLNAKHHAKEAAIIAKAGEPKAVTVATKMAGRGVDIKLGGDLSEDTIKEAQKVLRDRGLDPFRATAAQFDSAIAEVDPDYALRREKALELGGLHVIGTERHEARRIDNQLRGRSGRQGDPGSSRFYLSLEDDLMRRFGGPSVASLMERLGVEEDIPIEHDLVSRSIENAQAKIEGYNFDIRKHLLEYDDVLNRQRELIYGQRYRILTKDDLHPDVWEMIEEEVNERLDKSAIRNSQFVIHDLLAYLDEVFPLLVAPPDAPFRSPFALSANLTCFPPFTITFLAEQMAGLSPEALRREILETSRGAIDQHREHLLETVVGEAFEKAEEQYREGLARYTESLELRIDHYIDLAEEQGRTVQVRELLQHLQGVFPLPLAVKSSELRGLEIEQVKERLFEALELAYHQRVCDNLIVGIQLRIPEAIKLNEIRVSGLDPQDLKELLDQALARAYDEEAVAQLTQMREGKIRGNLLALVANVSHLATLELYSLERILYRAIATEHDKWAQRQLDEIEKVIEEGTKGAANPSPHEIAQLLLDVYYTERQSFDRGHRRRVSFVPRLPLSFLAMTKVEGMDRDELRRAVLAHLEKAVADRERVWGEQELARLEGERLVDLDEEIFDGLVKHLGQRRIGGSQERRIADLEDDLYDDVQRFLKIRELEGHSLVDLEMGDEIIEHLGRQLEKGIRERVISDLDEKTRNQIEGYLRAGGYFEDEEAEQSFLHQRLGDLDRRTYEGLAAHLGRERLSELRERTVAELDEETRQTVRDYLKGRGYFVDEDKIQRFFVHQRLSDLGEEPVHDACVYLTRERLERLRMRRIADLDVNTRQSVLGSLQAEGLLEDKARKERFAQQRLADLDEDTYIGLAQHLGGQQLLADRRIADLAEEVIEDLRQHLQGQGYFVDQAKVERFRQQRLSDLGDSLAEDVRRHLVRELKENLEEREIGQLEVGVRDSIRDYLDQTDYFVDEDKVQGFRQRPLADLDQDVLYGLAGHLGTELMAALDKKKFLNLDQEVRGSILQYLDMKGYLKKRAKRQQFIQRQSLSDLDEEIYHDVAHHLGRELLAEIKGARFAELAEDTRQGIWRYLKGEGYFTDEFKVELLPYQRISEFKPQTQEAIVSHLVGKLERDLAERRIADLGEGVRASIRRYLDENGYFVDEAKRQEVEQTKAADLAKDIYDSVTQYLGQRSLSEFDSLRVIDLEKETQDRVWLYLDEVGYFVDEAKKQQYAHQRLADLDSGTLEGLVQSLAGKLEREIEGQRVADLEDEVRQSLRRYLDGAGYFVDEEELARWDRQTLGELKKEDYEGLALALGRKRLDERRRQRLADLPEEMRESIRGYLRAGGYFIDQERLQTFQGQRVVDLDEETRADLLRYLRQEQEAELRERRIADLDEETRQDIYRFLEERGFALDETAMQPFKGQRLADLEPGLYDDLVRYLGHQRVRQSEERRISELDKETSQDIQAYLGRRVIHQIEKNVMLHFISRLWIEYLTDIEDLRQGIGLEAFGQRDPLVQYKIKAFQMFERLQANIRRNVAVNVFRWPPQPLKLA